MAQRVRIVVPREQGERLVVWSEDDVELGVLRVSRPRPRWARVESAMVARGTARHGPVHAVLKMALRAARALSDLPVDRLVVAVPGFGDVLGQQGFVEEDGAWSAPLEALGAGFTEMADAGVLGEACERRIYNRGDIIFRRGRRAQELCVVARGSLRLVGVDRNGDPREVALLGPGELLGEEIIAGGEMRPLHAVAHAHQVDLLCVERGKVPGLLERPAVRAWVDRALCARIRRLTARLVDGDEPELTERLARIAFDYALGAHHEQPACPINWLSAQAGTTPLVTRQRLGELWLHVSLLRDVAVIHDIRGLEGWLNGRAAARETPIPASA